MKQELSRRQSLKYLAAAGVGAASVGQLRAAEIGTASRQLENVTKRRPRIVAFDVIETLFDTKPLDPLLSSIGLPGGSLRVWFARFLRDAFALEVIGEYRPFHEVAAASLEALLLEHRLEAGREKIDKVLSGFAELPPHSDVKPAFQSLRDAGVRIITLTNGSSGTTGKMLAKAGLESFVEQTLSIDQVKQWKPARAVYLHAAKMMKVEPHEMALIAAHDWDTGGAGRAGLSTGGVMRAGKHFSTALPAPDVVGNNLIEVVRRLMELPA